MLVAGNYATSGAIDGDTATLDNPATGTYDNRNVGASKNVSTTVAIASANNGAASVYGYTLSSNTASGDIGTITAAALTVTADDKSRPQGTPNPPFTATYGGFQAGETTAVLVGTLAINTPATIAAPPGAYTITPFGQTSGNYMITYVNGTLTVGALPSNSAVIESDLLRPQFAALQWLGVGNPRSELSDRVPRALNLPFR